MKPFTFMQSIYFVHTAKDLSLQKNGNLQLEVKRERLATHGAEVFVFQLDYMCSPHRR